MAPPETALADAPRLASEPDYLAAVFGPAGHLARRVPGYEPRQGQLDLARAIDLGLREGRHVLAEAPCGTGKSFAYGAPAVFHAAQRKKRVVIATANLALQEQLVQKDLPRLRQVLPWAFSFAQLKGRGNYLCLDRLREESRLPLFGDDAPHVQSIVRWSRQTETGDGAEIALAPPAHVWRRFAVGPYDCKRDACPAQRECFAERARARAVEADIVVTNYHLLFAHVAVRRATGRDLVLPPFDALICDEAHEAADVAREFLGFELGPAAVAQLAGYAFALGLIAAGEGLRSASESFFAALAGYARSDAYSVRLQCPGFVDPGVLLTAVRAFETAAGGCDSAGEDKETRTVGRNAARLARLCATQLEEAIAQRDGNKVYWIGWDRRGRATLRARPIEISALLRDELFGRTPSVVLTSATLATEGHFDFARRELGVPAEAIEAQVASPFDFARQARLYIPDDLPEPNDPDFVRAAARALSTVVEQCDGRTLGLFASHQTLDAVHARVTVAPTRHRFLRQGERSRAELTRIFREDTHSVLLGTASFRTGLDVPGEALTGLVIDRLPFPPPTDPLVHALAARDPRAFWAYSLPRAVIALRQAVGRLIRTRGDVGVVVILDARLHTRRYRAAVLRSLPPMSRGTELAGIRAFLAQHAGAAQPTPSP